MTVIVTVKATGAPAQVLITDHIEGDNPTTTATTIVVPIGEEYSTYATTNRSVFVTETEEVPEIVSGMDLGELLGDVE